MEIVVHMEICFHGANISCITRSRAILALRALRLVHLDVG